jgi:uncharacterized protein YceK
MAFPIELVTMGAGFIASAATTLMSNAFKNRTEIMKLALAKAEVQEKIYAGARSVTNKGFQWTRRVIALSVIGTVLFSTMIAPYIWPDVQITVGLTEYKPGFWFLTEGRDAISWFTLPKGVVMTPVFSHMIYGITGLFFGNQVSK